MQRLALVTSAIAAQSPSPAYSKLTLELTDGAGVIWLNSLKDLNCLSTTMAREIKEALAHLDNDPAVKIILIRSKHGKVFCAGADIKHMNTHDYTTHPHNFHFLNIERAFKNTRKPVVSVVEGKALGGGFELALLTDIIIASPAASFGLP